MPNQITHIAITNKIFSKFFTRFDKREFYLGTVFPDIRKFGFIKRERTHFSGATMKQVLEAKTSFYAGIIFHNLVDEVFYNKVIVLPEVEGSVSIASVIKLLGDELLYSKVKNWPEIIKYYQDVTPEELTYNMKKATILKWHKILMNIFTDQPNDKNRCQFMIGINLSKKRGDEKNAALDKIRNQKKLIKFILDFYNDFEKSISVKA